MAVVTNDPIDLALDHIAVLFAERWRIAIGSRARSAWAVEVAALWRAVMDHADARGDYALAVLARAQYGYFNQLADRNLIPP